MPVQALASAGRAHCYDKALGIWAVLARLCKKVVLAAIRLAGCCGGMCSLNGCEGIAHIRERLWLATRSLPAQISTTPAVRWISTSSDR